MSVTRLESFTSDGRLRLEAFALYAAFAPIDARTTLVKIGISQNPFERVFEVHCGSPFPITKALWQHVGNRASALKCERTVLQLMSAKKTRGEWLKLEIDSAEDKALFNDSIRRAVLGATKRASAWKEIDLKAAFGKESRQWGLKA